MKSTAAPGPIDSASAGRNRLALVPIRKDLLKTRRRKEVSKKQLQLAELKPEKSRIRDLGNPRTLEFTYFKNRLVKGIPDVHVRLRNDVKENLTPKSVPDELLSDFSGDTVAEQSPQGSQLGTKVDDTSVGVESFSSDAENIASYRNVFSSIRQRLQFLAVKNSESLTRDVLHAKLTGSQEQDSSKQGEFNSHLQPHPVVSRGSGHLEHPVMRSRATTPAAEEDCLRRSGFDLDLGSGLSTSTLMQQAGDFNYQNLGLHSSGRTTSLSGSWCSFSQGSPVLHPASQQANASFLYNEPGPAATSFFHRSNDFRHFQPEDTLFSDVSQRPEDLCKTDILRQPERVKASFLEDDDFKPFQRPSTSFLEDNAFQQLQPPPELDADDYFLNPHQGAYASFLDDQQSQGADRSFLNDDCYEQLSPTIKFLQPLETLPFIDNDLVRPWDSDSGFTEHSLRRDELKGSLWSAEADQWLKPSHRTMEYSLSPVRFTTDSAQLDSSGTTSAFNLEETGSQGWRPLGLPLWPP